MLPYIQLGPITLSTYFTLISVAATLGSLWFIRRMEARNLSRVLSIDLCLVIMAFAFLGARFMHIFYEDFEFYRVQPMRVVEIWNGGFVFYGGLLGGMLGIYIFCLFKRIPFLLTFDMATIPMAFAYALGRFACFLNGCCFGKVCELPWAVNILGENRHPTQLYACAGELLIMVFLLSVEKRLRQVGQLAGIWFALHGVNRMLMEYFRDDPRGNLIMGMSVSSWLSVALICMGIGLIWPKPDPASELQ